MIDFSISVSLIDAAASILVLTLAWVLAVGAWFYVTRE